MTKHTGAGAGGEKEQENQSNETRVRESKRGGKGEEQGRD